MRRGLNQFEREVLADTGLSIPRFAHIRNRVYCSDCRQWFRASKYLGKELVREDKDADAWGVRIHPGIMCGRCGAKCREEAYGCRNVIHAKVPKRMSKRRWKIVVQRNMDKWESAFECFQTYVPSRMGLVYEFFTDEDVLRLGDFLHMEYEKYLKRGGK